ncbi:MAG: hypothetical protein E7394_06730 [Ruminococcaceae bacterium]|nr:hypothetical protein [Oscillospiraceae bacterium]
MNNRIKKISAFILAMIMMASIPVMSAAEVTGEVTELNLMSLLPIEEVEAYIDLAEIPLENLPLMTVGELFSHLRKGRTGELVEFDAEDTSVWANFFGDGGEYLYDTWKILDFGEPINILDHYFTDNYDVEVIVGSPNQLDAENVRYLIDFRLPEEYARMDLSGHIYNELYNFEVSEIANSIPNLKIQDRESVEILWYVENLVDSGYEFESDIIDGWLKADSGDTVKFAPTLEEMYNSGWWDNYLRMIVKYDDTAVMYDINAEYPEYVDMFEYSIYTQDGNGKRTEVETGETYGHESRKRIDGGYVYYYNICTEIKSVYSHDDEYYLGIKLSDDFSNCDIKVLEGWGHSEDKIQSWIIDGKIPGNIDITKEIVAQDMSLEDAGMKEYWLQSHGLDVTLCIISDNDIYIVPATIGASHTSDYVDVEGVFADVDGERVAVDNYISYDYEEEKIGDVWYYTEIITYHLDADFSDAEEYSVGMIFYDGDSYTANAGKVDKAVVGRYYSLEEAEDEPDIKGRLFADDVYYTVGAGYKTYYGGDGVDFTVFSGDDIHHLRIIVKNGDYAQEPDDEESGNNGAPQVGSDDRYFRVVDLYDGNGWLDTYTVPYDCDTYYSYGYQTLLINDTQADMTAVSPEVELGYHAKVYYGGTMENTGGNYSSRLSPRDFTKVPADSARDPKNCVKYTVSAQDHINQKNYWVTAVKKEEGAKLFVNGPDEREVFLDNYFGNAHDIFVANVGSEELTGISVTIDATNVKLDDYWTIGAQGNNTLAPFETTSNNTGSYYGELFNVAKIRLIPDGIGKIEGTLTITADGQEPRIIRLTGTAGNPRIDTMEVHDAVKYVPYSSIITTNNMHDWNKVTFSICEGTLPDGLTLYPSGEIYGVPKETGEFPITIKAKYTNSEFETSYADFVLTVKDNSDANINASVDDGYEITTRLPSKISKYSDMDFVIDGEFSEFIDLWLDGEKLVVDTDYTAVEGSTKITIKSKTFQNVGKGKHTISAEFRVGGDKNNELKTASQNFTIGSSSPAGGGGGGGGGVSSYAVTFETNGGTHIENQNIKGGTTIAVLPIPVKEGYVFEGWFKDEALTQPFDISEKITSKTKLYAKWSLSVSDKDSDDEGIFSDVSTGDWFCEDVRWAYENKIMVGYSDEQFAPSEAITSSMVVTVLARLANVDITAYENMHVEGVDDGEWYTPYANWAKEVKIADDISFVSPGEITREMMGVVLMRFFEYTGKDYVVTQEFVEFADADLISDKAMNAVQTLYKLGIFKGKGNNTIDPLGNTTRAEFAALIHRVHTFVNK